jgi:ABC-type xylose transport system permease subunit
VRLVRGWWALYLLLLPLYFGPSGYPQISHVYLAATAPLVLLALGLQIRIGREVVVAGLALLTYVACINSYWFSQYYDRFFIMTIFYFLFNYAIVLLIVGGLIMVFTFVLSKTVFGRHIYAVGGNRHAAELSGVRTRFTDFMIFVNMGLLSAVAAIVTTSRAGAGVASAGQLYELDAIAACFIGGCAVRGGVGKISGAMIGALIMGVLNMGLSILAVDSAWQQTIKGLVLLLAVALDVVTKRRRAYA